VNHLDLREEVARIAKQLIASGLVTGTSGNVSARTPEGDVLVTPMHTGIYRARPEVEAVVHTHSIYATTLACLGWPIPPVHYMLTTLSEDGHIPLAPYTTYGTEELAGYAAEALGESRNACLLQNHGTITVGESAEQAFSRTVVLEEMAEVYYRTRVLGEPVLLTPEQVQEVATKISGYGQTKPASPEGSNG
jgi:L-fuculose-phosphate aldolase